MNGYDFVQKILSETRNDVRPLIDLTGGIETEWLEFKAATKPEHGKYSAKENKWDYRWDVAKPLFALANTIGGAVLLGVGESKDQSTPVEPVSLSCSGFTGDRDEFMRNLQAQVLYPKDGWSALKQGSWRCPKVHQLFRAVWGSYEDEEIVIILVRPRYPEDGWLELEHSADGKETQTKVLSRRPGHVGENITTIIEIPGGEQGAWWKSRELERAELKTRWNLFLEEWKSYKRHDDATVERSISAYLAALEKDQSSRATWFGEKSPVASATAAIPDLEVEAEPGLQKSRIEKLRVLLEETPRVLLLGEPGAGKTTALRAFAASKALSWQVGQPWVLFASLSEYTGQGLRALLLESFPDLWWIDLQPRLNRGEIILLLDGLNECPNLFYEYCIQEIKALLHDHPTAKILVSSRLTHKPADLTLNTFIVSPMTRPIQDRFLSFYFGDTELAEELLGQIYSQPGAELIASSPIFLRMMAEIYRSEHKLPQSRANLYQASFSHWHQRESEKPATPLRWSESRTRNALARLSFEMRTTGKVSCSRNDAVRILEPEMGDDVGRFLDRVAQGLLLVVDKTQKDETVHFSHETMQEYLAAEYLVANEHRLSIDLLGEQKESISSNWTMPFVFALELNADPPREFLNKAWQIEPLLVAAALRDDDRLYALPLRDIDDRWVRGVLRAMRGEKQIFETLELALVSRLPPKHPLSQSLKATLQGNAFWYAASTHPAGNTRIKKLRKLILNRNSLWIELLPYAYPRNTDWLEDMSPAQRLLVGEHSGCDYHRLLGESTVVELCTLHRFKKINDRQILASWESALWRCNELDKDTNLAILLRTMAKIRQDKTTKRDWAEELVKKLNDAEVNRLREMSKNWLLSYRLLNLLVRLGVVNPAEIRDEPGRLKHIKSTMSPMNAYRFMKNGVLARDDMSQVELNNLLQQLNPKCKRDLVRRRFIDESDIRLSQHDTCYSSADLATEESRRTIKVQLVNKNWSVKVKFIHRDGHFGYAEHKAFCDDIHFYTDRIEDQYSRSLDTGDVLDVQIQPSFDKKKEQYGFSVVSGRLLSKST